MNKLLGTDGVLDNFLETFKPKTKIIGSSFMKSIYIFNILHHLRAVNESKSKV